MKLAVIFVVSLLAINSNLIEKSILDGKGTALLPSDFELMSEEMLRKKYPQTSRRPSEVYTDYKAEINVIFDHTRDQVSLEGLESVKDRMVGQFSQIPGMNLLNHQMRAINGREFFVVEFISPALDTEVYNLMFGTSYEGRLLMGTFNCTVANRPDWEWVGKKIVNSIELK